LTNAAGANASQRVTSADLINSKKNLFEKKGKILQILIQNPSADKQLKLFRTTVELNGIWHWN